MYYNIFVFSPAPCGFFGASIHPKTMISSAKLFHKVYSGELVCLFVGCLEVYKFLFVYIVKLNEYIKLCR